MSSMPKSAPLRTNQIVLAIAAALAPLSVQAQASDPSLPLMTVTSDREGGYTRANTSSATRTDTPLRELPASVHVVTEDLIRDLAITKPSELVSLVPSVQQVVGYGGVGSQWYTIRGFSNDAINYRDGYRTADKYAPRDLANVERVDFVMGPSSALYGSAPPAGAVNTITKTPFFGQANSVSFSLGSYATVRGTGDFNWSNNDLAVRLNVASDKANSFIDYEKPKNTLVAPSFLYRLSSDTEILYALEYFKTRVDGFSNGLPLADGVYDLRKGATSSMPWAQFNNENLSHRVEVKTRLDDNWGFRQGLFTERTRQNYRGVSPDFVGYTPGVSVNDYGLIYNAGPKNDHFNDVAQSEFSGALDLLGTRHRLLAGYEFAKSRFEYSNYNEAFDPAGFFGAPTGVNSFTGEKFLAQSNSRTNALYLNDQFKVYDLQVLLGLRHDWIQTSAVDPFGGPTGPQSDKALSSRLGLLYPLTPKTSVYYSFGQSFTPNLGLSLSGGVLVPQKSEQNEVGIKHAITPNLDATLAAFDIVKKNVPVASSDPMRFAIDSEQKSRGLEATLNGRLTASLQVIANLSHIDYAKVSQGDNAGNSLYGIPRDAFNLWAVQGIQASLPGALSVGLGVSSVANRPADSANSGFRLPSYTKVDAAIFYKQAKTRYALNFKNLNDAKVYDTADGYFVQRQTPRSVLATVTVDF